MRDQGPRDHRRPTTRCTSCPTAATSATRTSCARGSQSAHRARLQDDRLLQPVLLERSDEPARERRRSRASRTTTSSKTPTARPATVTLISGAPLDRLHGRRHERRRGRVVHRAVQARARPRLLRLDVRLRRVRAADWTAHDGETGDVSSTTRSRVLYDKAAHDALEQLRPGDWYYFSRSGYTGSQQYAPMTWSGDPDASFGEAEGLPAQVRATITLSMSGVAHVGSDIGGFKCHAQRAPTPRTASCSRAGSRSARCRRTCTTRTRARAAARRRRSGRRPTRRPRGRRTRKLHTRLRPVHVRARARRRTRPARRS